MKTGKILLITILLIMCFYVRTVCAVDIVVDSHMDGFTSGDSWSINRAGTQLTSSESNVTIDDSSGLNMGWVFTINVTDFTVEGISDPCVDTATLSARVDVEDWLSIALKDSANAEIGSEIIPATSGTDIPAGSYTVLNTIADSGNINVLNVQPGYGAGVYDFIIDYTIDLDDWLPDGTNITSTAASGLFSSASPVTVDNSVQKFQIFAGTYETTITYSVASTPP